MGLGIRKEDRGAMSSSGMRGGLRGGPRWAAVLVWVVWIACASTPPPPEPPEPAEAEPEQVTARAPTRPPAPRPPPAPTGPIHTRPLRPTEMRAHFIDVGEGSATLFEFSCGAALVDAGGEKNSLFDGRAALLEYLEAFFARRPDLERTLDLFVVSHPRIPHTRAARDVIERYRVRNVVDNGLRGGSGLRQQAALQRHARESPDVGYHAVRLDEIRTLTGLTNPVIDPLSCNGVDPEIRAFWGRVSRDPGWGARNGKPRFAEVQSHSVVLRVDFGESSFLLTGDLEGPALDDLVVRYRDTQALDVDVYQVGNHGALEATTPALLAAVRPRVAVISVGDASREFGWTAWQHGHPHRQVALLLASSEGGVTARRDPVDVQVGVRAQDRARPPEFVAKSLDAAVYATGWDGTVVVLADASGGLRIHTSR